MTSGQTEWTKYPTLVAKYFGSKHANLEVITPILTGQILLLPMHDASSGVELVANAVDELENDNPKAFLYPLLAYFTILFDG